MNITKSRLEYEELGFDTLPLRPGAKTPLRRGWKNDGSFRLWRNAPDGVNIGIRCGGGLAVVDCDEKNAPGTFENAENWFNSLGILSGEYPVVQTASGTGRHVYLQFAEDLPGHYINLSRDFGMGEFRYGPGAYVVAPPSEIFGGGVYSLIDGDFRQLPQLEFADMQCIISNLPNKKVRFPSIPRRAGALLNGKKTGIYKSRSEAEQALIVSLINADHSFESVLELFLQYPCAGKFAELRAKSEKNALRWLRRSYTRAHEWAESHESQFRQMAERAISWAQSRSWPGRTGAVDRAIFIAHASIAYKAGRLIYAASSRDLAERAGTSHVTASRASQRLFELGLVTIVKAAVCDYANVYRLEIWAGQELPLPHTKRLRECNCLSNLDAFRYKGLGKSAGEIFEALKSRPLTIDELANRTGRHKRTVKRALVRMSGIVDFLTGEILVMVESDNDLWYALPVDLDHVAAVIGTAGTSNQQRERYSAERRAHRKGLALMSDKDSNGCE